MGDHGEDMAQFIAAHRVSGGAVCQAADGCAAFHNQPQMTEEDFEDTALRWFPEKAEIIVRETDQDSFSYGYMERDFSKTLIRLLETWKDHELIWRYCGFLELIWRKGDSCMRNAMCVTVLEILPMAGENIWCRFGYYLSDAFRTWINDKVVPSNLALAGCRICRLTSFQGADLPDYSFPTSSDVGFPSREHTGQRQEENIFLLGSYDVIAGRLNRWLRDPDRFQIAVSNLQWIDIVSEYYRVAFRNEKSERDCIHILFSRFPKGSLRENIVGSFLHTMLIACQLTGLPDQKDTRDPVYFRCTEEEWNRTSEGQRHAIAASALKEFYTADFFLESTLIRKDPKTGMPDLHIPDDYARMDRQAYDRLALLLSRLPANMERIGVNLTKNRCRETYLGAEDDCLLTVIMDASFDSI